MKRISLCFCIMAVFFAAIGFSGCKQATENSNPGSSVDTSLWPRVYEPRRIVGVWRGTLTQLIYETGEKTEYSTVLDIYDRGNDLEITMTADGRIMNTGNESEFSSAMESDIVIRLSPDGNSIYYGMIASAGSIEGILKKSSY